MGRAGAVHGGRPPHPGAGAQLLNTDQGTAESCRLGIWGVFDIEDQAQAIYTHVLRSQLALRAPAADVRLFAPYGPDRPTRCDRGEPAQALGAWSPTRLAELVGRLDLVVVGGAHLAATDETYAELYGVGADEIAARGVRRFFACPDIQGAAHVRWHATDSAAESALREAGLTGSVDLTPHPAVLLPRVLSSSVLAKRLEYLRVMGWYPRQAALVLQGHRQLAGSVPRLMSYLLKVLDEHHGMVPVLTQVHQRDDQAFTSALSQALTGAGRAFHEIPPSISSEDFAAGISSADGFIGSSTAACLTAVAYGTPWAMLAFDDVAPVVATGAATAAAVPAWAAGDPRVAARPEALDQAFAHGVKQGPDVALRDRLQADVDIWLDRIVLAMAESVQSRSQIGGSGSGTGRSAMESELRTLRLAHRARAERANTERALLADRVAKAEAELAELRPELEQLRIRIDEESSARARAELECEALRSTRTFQWTASARSLYQRFRSYGSS